MKLHHLKACYESTNPKVNFTIKMMFVIHKYCIYLRQISIIICIVLENMTCSTALKCFGKQVNSFPLNTSPHRTPQHTPQIPVVL